MLLSLKKKSTRNKKCYRKDNQTIRSPNDNKTVSSYSGKNVCRIGPRTSLLLMDDMFSICLVGRTCFLQSTDCQHGLALAYEYQNKYKQALNNSTRLLQWICDRNRNTYIIARKQKDNYMPYEQHMPAVTYNHLLSQIFQNRA